MTAPDVEQLRQTTEQIVGAAAGFVRSRRTQVFSTDVGPAVRAKSSPTDPVTVVDTETEQLVRDMLAMLRPGEPILGEEGGGGPARDAGVRWVVDPIDGTVNFLYGIPAYAVSLAVQIDGVSVAGAVADVCGGQIYSAAAGRGAAVITGRGRTPLRCTAVRDLSLALVSTGFGYQPRRRAAQAALLAGLLPEVRDIRRFGSAALDLCHVAAGRLDAHYEHGLNRWDWAAGALIAAEAGALVTLPAEPAGLLVAAAPGIAAALAAALQAHGGAAPIG